VSQVARVLRAVGIGRGGREASSATWAGKRPGGPAKSTPRILPEKDKRSRRAALEVEIGWGEKEISRAKRNPRIVSIGCRTWKGEKGESRPRKSSSHPGRRHTLFGQLTEARRPRPKRTQSGREKR